MTGIMFKTKSTLFSSILDILNHLFVDLFDSNCMKDDIRINFNHKQLNSYVPKFYRCDTYKLRLV